jgi:hypothetical protein
MILLKHQFDFMYGNWVIAKGSSIGGRHIEDNLSCQDSNAVFYNLEMDYGIAIVSDGAGSANHSDLGSKIVVEKGIELLNEKFTETSFQDLVQKEQIEVDTFFIEFYKLLYKKFEEYSLENDLPIKSLAATSIIVVFSKSGLICSHIGDGRAGYQDNENTWFSVLEPFKGEEANQTIFITSDIWESPNKFIRTTRVKNQIQSFTLMSDGCESATFELNRFNEETQFYEKLNNPYPKFFNPNIAILRELALSGKSSEEIDELWLKFLHNGNSKFESEIDDKTLILGTLKNKVSNA